MYTVDASVWVNSFDYREEGHQCSRQVLQLLRARSLPVIVPNLVLAEVAGAISRTRQDGERAGAFVAALQQLPNVRFLPLDRGLAQRAAGLAGQHRLRGADAVYAAVAAQSGCTLLTLDSEHLLRLAPIVPTRTPAQVLSDLRTEPIGPAPTG